MPSSTVHTEPESIVAPQLRLVFSHTVFWLSRNPIGRKGTCQVCSFSFVRFFPLSQYPNNSFSYIYIYIYNFFLHTTSTSICPFLYSPFFACKSPACPRHLHSNCHLDFSFLQTLIFSYFYIKITFFFFFNSFSLSAF